MQSNPHISSYINSDNATLLSILFRWLHLGHLTSSNHVKSNETGNKLILESTRSLERQSWLWVEGTFLSTTTFLLYRILFLFSIYYIYIFFLCRDITPALYLPLCAFTLGRYLPYTDAHICNIHRHINDCWSVPCSSILFTILYLLAQLKELPLGQFHKVKRASTEIYDYYCVARGVRASQ